MSCEEIRHLISMYIDDQLEPADSEKVKEHLTGCSDCSEYYYQLLKLQKMADDFEPGGETDYWLKQKDSIIDRISEVESSGITPVPVKRSRAVYYKVLTVAATIALVAIISIFEVKYDDPDRLPFSKKSSSPVQSYHAPDQSELEDEKGKKDKNSESFIADEEIVGQMESIEVQSITIEKEKKSAPKPISPSVISISDEGTDEYELSTRPESAPAEPPEEELFAKKVAIKPPRGGKAEKAQAVLKEPKLDISPIEDELIILEKHEKKINGVPGDDADIIKKITKETAEAGSIGTYMLDETIVVKADMDRLDKFVHSSQVKITKEQLPETELTDEGISIDNQEYSEWRRKVDTLESKYGYLLSIHREEIEAKSRMGTKAFEHSDDLSEPPFLEMADAYYNLARVTPLDDERKSMLLKLKRLIEVADSTSVVQIKKYLSDLQSDSK